VGVIALVVVISIAAFVFVGQALNIQISSNGEKFSELYLLGPEHLAQNYPSNITIGQNYTVYLGITNHLSVTTKYEIYIKIKNQTELYPNATTGDHSPLQPLVTYDLEIDDNQTKENPITFGFQKVTFTGDNKSILNQLMINNEVYSINKQAIYNNSTKGNNYQFFFELWTYDEQTNSWLYNNRFVALNLHLE
jgi:uncharacterized membrane protein